MILSTIFASSLLGQIVLPEPTVLRMAKMKYQMFKFTLPEPDENGHMQEPIDTHICSGVANVEVVSWNTPDRPRNISVRPKKGTAVVCDTTLKQADGIKFIELKLQGNMGVWFAEANKSREHDAKTYYATLEQKSYNPRTNAWEKSSPAVIANWVDNLELRSISSSLTPPMIPMGDMMNGNEVMYASVEFIDDAQ